MEYFKKIYLDYKHQVYFFVKKFISNTEDVEDVVDVVDAAGIITVVAPITVMEDVDSNPYY